MTSSLHVALVAARAQDYARARDALIEAWRARRSPVLAELVELLDARAPDAVTASIATLVTPRALSSLENLRELAKLDDPRLARFAIESLVRLPFTAATAKDFLVELASTAGRHDDPRLAERAPAIRDAVTTRIGRLAIRRELLKLVDRAVVYARPVAAPTAAEAALEGELSALVEPLRRTSRSADALLAEIYANPADDAPRLVYADLLSAHDDPRGERIVLQIERARSGVAEPSERERELLKRHGKAWLGALAPVLSWGKGYARTTFRRGFVADADIILSVGKKLRPLRRDPAWATVETIDGLYRDDDRLIENAPLRALRQLEIAADRIPQLAARADKLVGVARVHLDVPAPAALLRAAFPNLVAVAAYFDAAAPEAAAFAACGTRHVELLHTYCEVPQMPAAAQAFAALLDSLIGAPAMVERLTLHPPFNRHPRPAPFELVRDSDGRFALQQREER